MSKNRIVAGLAALLFSLVANAAAPERVLVTTNMGSFIIELQRDRAPLTVENFLGYVKSGHYTNTLFHRVVANFLVQGGGVGTDYKGKPTLKPIPNESGNGLKNLRGTVGLARASGPHSGDCQFFINVADNDSALDPLPTRWGYAVFGRVVEGMEVVDRISVSPTGPAGPFKADAPLQPVIIQKIELLAAPADAAAPASAAPNASAPATAAPATPPAGGASPSPGTPAATPPAGDNPPADPAGAPPPK
jgi:peptidyl-prolyl cis-trans isomerase A (cyclophilin A)/peptidyl-prolyl cis-trans isomerase B (cyclophilin B)